MQERDAESRPFVKIPEQSLEFELRYIREVDRVRVGGPLSLGRRVIRSRSRARERKHGTEY